MEAFMDGTDYLHVGEVFYGKMSGSPYKIETIFQCIIKDALNLLCRNETTGEMYEVKFEKYKNQSELVKENGFINDPNKNSQHKVIDYNYSLTQFSVFLVIKKLDLTLSDYMLNNDMKPLGLDEIRRIAQRLFIYLFKLKGDGYVHMKIQPDHVALNNQKLHSLIGYATRQPESFLQDIGSIIPVQANSFSAPELYLGGKLTCKLDTWSVGCVLAYLFLGRPLYPEHSKYDFIRAIMKSHGTPDASLLNGWTEVSRYFKWDKSGTKPAWRLKTAQEYSKDTGETVEETSQSSCDLQSLDDLLKMAPPTDDPDEIEDLKAFVDLLKEMLTVNPEDRIDPEDALNHTFITTEHLVRDIKLGYRIDLSLNRGRTIKHKSDVYTIEEVVGAGAFGQVVKCRKAGTDEIVVIKIVKPSMSSSAATEARSLRNLRKLDSNKYNLISLLEYFKYRSHSCFVFELLDLSLLDLVRRTETALSLNEIRVITQQMLVALKGLKNIGLTHCDIKEDNIMLVNHESQPYKLKLIDFGVSSETSKLFYSDICQPFYFRAPEILMGLPLDEGVDMWSLACVLVAFYTGRDIHSDSQLECDYLQRAFKLFGLPDTYLMEKALKCGTICTWDKSGPEPSWTLKAKQEYEQTLSTDSDEDGNEYAYTDESEGRDEYADDDEVTEDNAWDTGETIENIDSCLSSMDEIVPDTDDPDEIEDCKAFVDLVKKMLTVNPADRIDPEDALNHPFVTMEHLGKEGESFYVEDARDLMAVCTTTDHPADSGEGLYLEKANEIWTRVLSINIPANVPQCESSCSKEGGIRATSEDQSPNGTIIDTKPATEASSKGTTTNQSDKKHKDTLQKEPFINNTDGPSATCNKSKGTSCQMETSPFLVEIKTKEKHLRSLKKFSSRVFKNMTSCWRGSEVSNKPASVPLDCERKVSTASTKTSNNKSGPSCSKEGGIRDTSEDQSPNGTVIDTKPATEASSKGSPTNQSDKKHKDTLQKEPFINNTDGLSATCNKSKGTSCLMETSPFLVEVKTKEKHLRSLKKLSSRVFKNMTSCWRGSEVMDLVL